MKRTIEKRIIDIFRVNDSVLLTYWRKNAEKYEKRADALFEELKKVGRLAPVLVKKIEDYVESPWLFYFHPFFKDLLENCPKEEIYFLVREINGFLERSWDKKIKEESRLWKEVLITSATLHKESHTKVIEIIEGQIGMLVSNAKDKRLCQREGGKCKWEEKILIGSSDEGIPYRYPQVHDFSSPLIMFEELFPRIIEKIGIKEVEIKIWHGNPSFPGGNYITIICYTVKREELLSAIWADKKVKSIAEYYRLREDEIQDIIVDAIRYVPDYDIPEMPEALLDGYHLIKIAVK